MFYEIIYTRCGKGIDITNGGKPKEGNGFKTYACSGGLFNNRDIDIKYLASIVGMTAPSNPPEFADNAYMYFVYSRAMGCLMEFHPVENDTTEEGSFSRRGGNYLNQLFIGSLGDVYPYEAFGNKELWDAKGKGQAYYYENEPRDIPVRSQLISKPGPIGLNEISRFVTGQRCEAVKSAVAFLISQYTTPLNERKYLVIKESNTENIELWIAAIENAFSTRMAAGLPFATRMTDFVNKNRYAVNAAGIYQDQIDLQNPNQKRFFRAMIVGVDSRDEVGAKGVFGKVSAPFIVLDGESDTLSAETDVNHPFYQLVTSYSDEHIRFCREFLQMLDLWEPSDGVFQLYEAFKSWEVYEKGKQLESLLRTVKIIKNYKLLKTPFSVGVYNLIKKNLGLHIKQDVSCASELIGWIVKHAEVFGDFDTNAYIVQLISNTYIDALFTSPIDKVASDLSRLVYQGNYESYVFSQLLNEECLEKHKKRMASFTRQDWLAFLNILLKAPELSVGTNNIFASYVITGIRALYKEADYNGVKWLAEQFQGKTPQTASMHLMSEAKCATDKRYRTYLVRIWASIFAETFITDDGLSKAYDYLGKFGLEQEISVVLERRVSADMTARERERYLSSILKDSRFEGIDLSTVLQALDYGLTVTDKRSSAIAALIQENLHSGICCINSAHICAMEVLDDLKSKDVLKQLKVFFAQGFPCVEDETYCNNLIKRLVDKRMSLKVFFAIVKNASKSRFYNERIVEGIFQCIGTRNDFAVDRLFQTVEEMVLTNYPYANQLYSVVVEKCSQFKSFDKNMSLILKSISPDETKAFFKRSVVWQAKALHEKNRQPSFMERLFGKGNASQQNDDEDD